MTPRLERYLTTSRNPRGRDRLLALAAEVDDQWVGREIRLHRRLCLALAAIAAVVLLAGYPG